MLILRRLILVVIASVIFTACGNNSNNAENDAMADPARGMATSTVILGETSTAAPSENPSSKHTTIGTETPVRTTRSGSLIEGTQKDMSQNTPERDGIFGAFPCSGSGPSQFTSNFYSIDSITGIRPMGKMASSHVTPTDHLYIHRNPNPDIAQDNEYVVAPADGVIVKISRFPEDQQYIYQVPDPKMVPDYRVIIMHSCTFFTIFIHLGELAPAISEVTGEIANGRTWFGTTDAPIPVKAGDPIAKFGGQSLDWSVHDSDTILSGFIVPQHYETEPWKIHTVDPFPFYEGSLRNALEAKAIRVVEPIAGKIDYDIEGAIIGNWFLDGTVNYSGSLPPGTPRYWNGHLSIAYGYIEPSQIRISIGHDMADDMNNDCRKCRGSYGVKYNSPDPATVTAETGLVKYELMSRERGGGREDHSIPAFEMVGEKSLGTFLVKHLGDRTIRVEIVPGKRPDEVMGFTNGALIYRR
ncbi:MAG: hypothetical protein FI725_03860 [SAR202 cluster bacterium]|nr:hypothetical protein [SAR202 cluster bacterium]|tara:strand:+ start:3108 stop:4514 length:1407 start_codon:yes stop_codon:yes gene_type:complete